MGLCNCLSGFRWAYKWGGVYPRELITWKKGVSKRATALLTERRFSLDQFRYIRIHTWFRGLEGIKQRWVDGPLTRGALSSLWAGGLISSTLLKLFGGPALESLSKDWLLAFYPANFLGLSSWMIFHYPPLTPETGGGWWNVSGKNCTHRMCKRGFVLWTSTSQTGQWNEVWRYFTIQLRQTAN